MHLQIANSLEEFAKQFRETVEGGLQYNEEVSAAIGMAQAAVDLRAAYAKRHPDAEAKISPPAEEKKHKKNPKPE